MNPTRRNASLAVLGAALAWTPAAAAPSADEDDASLSQDEDYAAGRAAIKAGDFGAAVRRFQLALLRFPEAADLHNELGYSHRKLRQFDKAFEHYKRALAIDPRHRSAHEYIGEAYLLVGDMAGAERHLAALRSICVLPCEELNDLQKAINDHRVQAKAR